REFIVGTGGAGLYPFPTVQPNSQVRNNTTFGVLKLTLHATSYDWQFVPIAGQTFTDSGTGNCVGATGTNPTPTRTQPPAPTATRTATVAPTATKTFTPLPPTVASTFTSVPASSPTTGPTSTGVPASSPTAGPTSTGVPVSSPTTVPTSTGVPASSPTATQVSGTNLTPSATAK